MQRCAGGGGSYMYRFARCYIFCLLSTAAIIHGGDQTAAIIHGGDQYENDLYNRGEGFVVQPRYDWRVLRWRGGSTSSTNPPLTRSKSSPSRLKGKRPAPKQVKIFYEEKPLSEFEEKVRTQSSEKASDKKVRFDEQVRFQDSSSSEESEEDVSDEE
jgi:hypothetical protein